MSWVLISTSVNTLQYFRTRQFQSMTRPLYLKSQKSTGAIAPVTPVLTTALHYVPNINVYHTYSIYIVACLVCYYRALPIFFLIHLKRWLNKENLILQSKICKNFLISNASLILALDHQKQRVIREYYNIYGPWLLVFFKDFATVSTVWTTKSVQV